MIKSLLGLAEPLFRHFSLSRGEFLGPNQVGVNIGVHFRALRLPGRGCDLNLVHFYMAEVRLVSTSYS